MDQLGHVIRGYAIEASKVQATFDEVVSALGMREDTYRKAVAHLNSITLTNDLRKAHRDLERIRALECLSPEQKSELTYYFEALERALEIALLIKENERACT